jgi:hypothetical protein
VLKRYRSRLRQMQERLKQTAFHSYASFTVIDTSLPLDRLLLHDLRKSGALA